MHRQEGACACGRPGAQGCSSRVASRGCRTQVLSKEEYACWLQGHLEAESSLDNREELLFQSALRLETNLHLLGNLMRAPLHGATSVAARWPAGAVP